MNMLKPFILLIRPNYQVNFIEVIVGVLFVLPVLSFSLLTIVLKILGLFFCFGLFYGGIYTLNDIADIEDDKKDKRKKLRMLPSGKISIRNALIFAVFLIFTGFSLAFFSFGITIAEIFLIFLIINLLYTFLLKKIAFVELLTNCLTHPPRLVLGASLVAASIPSIFLLGYYFFIVGLGLKVRLIMMENGGSISRPSLDYYTPRRVKTIKVLLLLILIVFATLDKSVSFGWYLVLLFLYLIFVFDFPLFKPFAKFFRITYIGKQA